MRILPRSIAGFLNSILIEKYREKNSQILTSTDKISLQANSIRVYFIDRNSDLKVQTAIDFLILVILVQELPNADLRNARGNVCNPV